MAISPPRAILGKIAGASAAGYRAVPFHQSAHRKFENRSDIGFRFKSAPNPPQMGKRRCGIGPAILLVFTKGKLLLLGLTKLSTLLSMLAFAGVYWALYGWTFAVGMVISIYIHEMGHVLTLREYGIPASAPMFIPGFGAFIRLKQLRITPIQDSRVGLAGPIYGWERRIRARRRIRDRSQGLGRDRAFRRRHQIVQPDSRVDNWTAPEDSLADPPAAADHPRDSRSSVVGHRRNDVGAGNARRGLPHLHEGCRAGTG